MLINLPLTVTAATYSAGKCVGGLLKLPGLGPVTGRCAFVDVQLADKNIGNLAVGYEMHVFETAPTGTYADNTAWNVADADRPHHQGFIPLAGMVALGTGGGLITVSPLYKRFSLVGDTLYAFLVTRGAPVFAGINDLVLRLQAEVVGAA